MGWREIKARMEKAGIKGPIKEDWTENPMTNRVIETWELTRPRAIAKLRAAGGDALLQEAARVAKACGERAEELWKAGLTGGEALIEAERELIHIPDDQVLT